MKGAWEEVAVNDTIHDDDDVTASDVNILIK